ncbi:hypothetical protein CK219_26945 [Mesorhizobium sp. WSM4313]|nr:hypothetical protein CK219_26945 [Mesorhizobium sp. WSM4313]
MNQSERSRTGIYQADAACGRGRNIKTPAQFGDMARYYFDSFDSGIFVRDDEGTELRDMEAVRNQAMRALRDMLSETPFEGQRVEMFVDVRDEGGKIVTKVKAVIEIT